MSIHCCCCPFGDASKTPLLWSSAYTCTRHDVYWVRLGCCTSVTTTLTPGHILVSLATWNQLWPRQVCSEVIDAEGCIETITTSQVRRSTKLIVSRQRFSAEWGRPNITPETTQKGTGAVLGDARYGHWNLFLWSMARLLRWTRHGQSCPLTSKRSWIITPIVCLLKRTIVMLTIWFFGGRGIRSTKEHANSLLRISPSWLSRTSSLCFQADRAIVRSNEVKKANFSSKQYVRSGMIILRRSHGWGIFFGTWYQFYLPNFKGPAHLDCHLRIESTLNKQECRRYGSLVSISSWTR